MTHRLKNVLGLGDSPRPDDGGYSSLIIIFDHPKIIYYSRPSITCSKYDWNMRMTDRFCLVAPFAATIYFIR